MQSKYKRESKTMQASVSSGLHDTISVELKVATIEKLDFQRGFMSRDDYLLELMEMRGKGE